MESIEELRELTQREKIEARERPWGYVMFQRGPSIYITRLLLATRITPNHITIADIAAGLLGCVLLLSQDWKIKLLGLIFIYINLLLDRVDGELARYRNTHSLRGIYLDEINHLVIPPLFFLALAWSMSGFQVLMRDTFFILLGSLAAMAVIFLRITHNIPYHIFVKKYLKYPERLQKDLGIVIRTEYTPISWRTSYATLYDVLKIIHQFQDFFIILVVTLFALIIDRVFFPLSPEFYPISAWLIPLYTLLFWGITFENIAKGVLGIDTRMRELSETIRGKDEH
jgi:phosphatidylglycerophosphate synthase